MVTGKARAEYEKQLGPHWSKEPLTEALSRLTDFGFTLRRAFDQLVALIFKRTYELLFRLLFCCQILGI